MAINLAALRDLLYPGLAGVEGKYEMIKPQYSKIFDTKKSKYANERVAEVRLLPLAQIKPEGQGVAFDNESGERWIWNFENFTVGLGYAITREAIEDNQYKSEFSEQNLNLADAFLQTKEIFGANILNTATTYNNSFGGDGVSLCNTAHPIDGGTIANRPSIDMDLSEASLLSATVAIRANFKDLAGLKVMARARKVIVPPALFPVAARLMETDLRPGTSDNDVNALKNEAGGLEGWMVADFLTSPFAWFVRTSIPGLVHYKRRGFEMDMDTDQTTMSLIVIGSERYSFGYQNWRSIFGNFPTS